MLAFSLCFAAALCGLAAIVVSTQQQARRALEDRFETRMAMARDFVDSYADDLLRREGDIARRFLDEEIDLRTLANVSTALGFESAEVTDADGVPLAVHPVGAARVPRPGAVEVTAEFTSVLGEARTLRGTVDLSRSPIGSYLRHAVPIAGHQLYLVDDSGLVLAGTSGEGGLLAAALGEALAGAPEGEFLLDGAAHRFVAGRVEGRPWRVVETAPTAELYRPLGPTTYTPWLVFAFFAVAGTLVLGLVRRLYRRELSLEALSNHDPLTGLANRRSLDEAVVRIDASARRYGTTTGVLVLDVDHFKQVNDLHGHAAGDAVLQAVAACLVATLRPTDVVARVGGEEFLAVLPGTDAAGAAVVAERVRAAVAQPILVPGAGAGAGAGAGGTVPVTVTISVGCAAGPTVAPLLSAADAALYRAKSAGRDRVEVAQSSVPPGSVSVSSSSAAELMQ